LRNCINHQPIQIRLSPGLAKDSKRAKDFDAVTVNIATIDRYISRVDPVAKFQMVEKDFNIQRTESDVFEDSRE
jgi:hypothetical protein